jgi:hypothetical protein
MDIHQELVKIALPHIEAYHDDLLKHDKTEIDNYPEHQFLHFTGSTGTCMVTFYNEEDFPAPGENVPYLFGHADRHHILKGIMEVINCIPRINRNKLMLYCNGKTLKAVTYDQAKELGQSYTHNMSYKFAKLAT